MFGDFIYLGFGKENSSVKAIDFGGSLVSSSLSTSSTLRGITWMLGASYAVQTGQATFNEILDPIELSLSTSPSPHRGRGTG